MKKCLIGFGANLGRRLATFEAAARQLKVTRVSPVYETSAMIPSGAPASWNKPFLNAVAEMFWEGSAEDLLGFLKQTEISLGRRPGERWAPREIDLDLLLFGEERISGEQLRVPHKGMWERSFVLDPLKDLEPSLKIPGHGECAMQRARFSSGRTPNWMGILNVTPDSFSDGGVFSTMEHFAQRVSQLESAAYLDLGAESTRPGAIPVTPEEEWLRLEEPLRHLKETYRNRIFRPRLSVDTRNAITAERALELGADLINDVSGLSDPRMLEVVCASGCEYVLMHSLSVPADGKRVLPEAADPVKEVKEWAQEKLQCLSAGGVNLDRVLFDPGVGFGKTGAQSQELIRRIGEFFDLPCRILVGHSRKSFLCPANEFPAVERDWESVGVSLRLGEAGVDVIRVHEPGVHARAYRAFQGAKPCPHSV